MGEIKQINIKNRTYYFYNDIINLDEFDGSKIKVDRKNFNDINIYYLGYEYKKKITECNEINSVNRLYLRIKDMNDQFKKGKSDNAWYFSFQDHMKIKFESNDNLPTNNIVLICTKLQ